MAEPKQVKTRIINKHATAAVWNESDFRPLQAEMVIYDPGTDPKDGKTYSQERFKIGDGTHTVNELPFVAPPTNWNQTDSSKADYIENKPPIKGDSESVKIVSKNINFAANEGSLAARIEITGNDVDAADKIYMHTGNDIHGHSNIELDHQHGITVSNEAYGENETSTLVVGEEGIDLETHHSVFSEIGSSASLDSTSVVIEHHDPTTSDGANSGLTLDNSDATMHIDNGYGEVYINAHNDGGGSSYVELHGDMLKAGDGSSTGHFGNDGISLEYSHQNGSTSINMQEDSVDIETLKAINLTADYTGSGYGTASITALVDDAMGDSKIKLIAEDNGNSVTPAFSSIALNTMSGIDLVARPTEHGENAGSEAHIGHDKITFKSTTVMGDQYATISADNSNGVYLDYNIGDSNGIDSHISAKSEIIELSTSNEYGKSAVKMNVSSGGGSDVHIRVDEEACNAKHYGDVKISTGDVTIEHNSTDNYLSKITLDDGVVNIQGEAESGASTMSIGNGHVESHAKEIYFEAGDADPGAIRISEKNVTLGTSSTTVSINGILDADIPANRITGTIPQANLPSYVDDVLEYTNLSAFPTTGEAGKIYIALDTNKTYRWSGTTYAPIGDDLALGETSSTAFRGDYGKIAYEHSQTAHAPSNAEANVQSNWNETNSSSDAYIANKPPVKNGDGQNSMVLLTGDANGKYSVAGGTNDSSLVSDLVGSVLGSLTSIDTPTAEGDMSLSFGAGTKSLTAGTIALGAKAIAGCKGFYWWGIDFNTNKITLSTNQKSILSSRAWSDSAKTQLAKWSDNDKISIVNNIKHGWCSTVTEIDSDAGTITVDKLPFTSAENPTIKLFDDYAIFNPSKPQAGVVDFGLGSISLGLETTAAGTFSTALGYQTKTVSDFAFTEGYQTVAAYAAHGEGYIAQALGRTAHAENNRTKAIGNDSHSEGKETEAIGQASHSQGMNTFARGKASFAGGTACEANGENSVALGNGAIASAQASFAFGQAWTDKPTTQASGIGAVAFGGSTLASGVYSTATGYGTKAQYSGAFATGRETETGVAAEAAFAEGRGTKAMSNYQHAQGKFNVEDSAGTYAVIVGNGTNDAERSNAYTLDWKGNGKFAGNVTDGSGNTIAGAVKKAQTVETSLNTLQNSVVKKSDIGTGNTVGSANSLAIGTNNTINNDNNSYGANLVAGKGNNVATDGNGGYSVTFGGNCTNNGVYSLTNGMKCEAYANDVLVTGRANIVNNKSHYSFNTGYENITQAGHEATMAAGRGLKTGRSHQSVVGEYNAVSSDALFVVGNGTGTADTSRSNALTVNKNGDIIASGKIIDGEGNILGEASKCIEVYGPEPVLPALNVVYQDTEVHFKVRVKNNEMNWEGTDNSPYYQYFDRSLTLSEATQMGYYNETFTIKDYSSGGSEQELQYNVSIEFSWGHWIVTNDTNGVVTFLREEDLTVEETGNLVTAPSNSFSVINDHRSSWVPAIKIGNTILTETKLKKIIAFIDGIEMSDEI